MPILFKEPISFSARTFNQSPFILYTMSDSEHDLIPIVDLAASAPADQSTGELCKAFREVGFAYIKNHGIPEEKIQEAFSWVR